MADFKYESMALLGVPSDTSMRFARITTVEIKFPNETLVFNGCQSVMGNSGL